MKRSDTADCSRPSFLDRIDACSALAQPGREHAALALYTEMAGAAEATIDAVTWRAMAIELGACALRYAAGCNAQEFIRARSADAHQRADFVGRVAARTRQVIATLHVEAV